MSTGDKIKVALVAGLFLLVSSCEGAMAHSNKEKPDKPSVEKPTPPVEVPVQTVEPRTQDPRVEAEVCGREPRPECRTVAPGVRRAAVKVAPVYPAPFLPMAISPHVTRDGGPIAVQVTHGKPKVSTFSTCADQGKSRDCRVKPNVVVNRPTPVVRSVVKPNPKMQLPFGQ